MAHPPPPHTHPHTQHTTRKLTFRLPLTPDHIKAYQSSTPDLINQTATLHAEILNTSYTSATPDTLDTLASQFTTLLSQHMDHAATVWPLLPDKKPRPPQASLDPTWLPKKTRIHILKLRKCSKNNGPLPAAQALLNTTDYLSPDAIKQQCQARIRQLLRATTTDKINKIKTRVNAAYDSCPKLSHRRLKIKSGLLPPAGSASTLHRITKPDKTTASSPSAVIDAVHSHFATELSRATPPELPVPPWEHPDNPDNYTIEPRGDPSLTLADMITRDTFDKTLNSLGTGKAPGPDGIPNEIIKFLPPATRSALFSLLSLLARKSYTPHEWCNSTTCLLHKKGDPTLL